MEDNVLFQKSHCWHVGYSPSRTCRKIFCYKIWSGRIPRDLLLVWVPAKTLQKFFPFALFGLAWLEVLSLTLRSLAAASTKGEGGDEISSANAAWCIPSSCCCQHSLISSPRSSRPWHFANFWRLGWSWRGRWGRKVAPLDSLQQVYVLPFLGTPDNNSGFGFTSLSCVK